MRIAWRSWCCRTDTISFELTESHVRQGVWYVADVEDVASDRLLITALMTKNRTYGPRRGIHMLVLTNLNGIIQDLKRLRVTTMLGPEQLDYICVRFAE